jgi:hypothetical protein
MKRLGLILLLMTLAGGVCFTPVDARPRWGGHIDRFYQHDVHTWRRGSWFYGRHSHRLGWWWIVNGLWYWYPSPVYPYPNPYVPPVVIQTPPAPPVVVQPQPQASVWYYCDQPAGYYPYVPECPGGWRTVPATPPANPAPAAPSPPPPGSQAR